MSGLRTDLALIGEWVEPGSHVLDLGCGDGTLLAHLRDNRRVTGYGLEIDDDNIVKCLHTGVCVIQTDLDKGLAEIEHNSFDYVIMTQTLQAVRHPDKLLQEMLRIGRQAIVTFPNFGHWQARLQLFFQGRMPISRALPSEWYDTPNIHLCTLRDFENLCRKQGIEILQRAVVDPRHRTSPVMRLLPNLMGEIALYRFCKRT
jgi:methionine biosynthesis protein MetW